MAKRKRRHDGSAPASGASAPSQATVKGRAGTEPEADRIQTERWSKSKKKRMRRRGLLSRGSNSVAAASRIGDGNAATGARGRRGSEGRCGGAEDVAVSSAAPQESKTSSTADLTRKSDISTVRSIAMKRPKSALQQAFLDRLSGSRFRQVNEELYTTTSSSALERFQSNPVLFEQYHEGFRNQVKQWPVNPVDVILRWLISLELRRRQDGNNKKGDAGGKLVVADFGCGDAKLATQLLRVGGGVCVVGGNDGAKMEEKAHLVPSDGPERRKKRQGKRRKGNRSGMDCPFIVHSFDLVSNGNPLVTACDMADVPLEDVSVDVGVFSLALMGTNVADFIREAHRVLRKNGILKIAEVRSRFESTASGSTKSVDRKAPPRKSGKPPAKANNRTDGKLLDDFLHVMFELGFSCTKLDRSNKMFFLMEFEKTGRVPSKTASFTPKACIYKRR